MVIVPSAPNLCRSMAKMSERRRPVYGHSGLVSFADLGYVRVGLDDFWQDCGAGHNGSFHDAQGYPLIDTEAFPSLKTMVTYGSSRGLEVGWCELRAP